MTQKKDPAKLTRPHVAPDQIKPSSRHNKAYRTRHPAKRLAHSRVNQAKRAGLLTPQPCSECGGTAVEAHHDDYARPLDVRWLCKACHEIQHHGPVDSRPKKQSTQPEYYRARRARLRAAKPAVLTKKQRHAEEAKLLRQQGASYSQIAMQYGISKATAYKWVNNPSYQ